MRRTNAREIYVAALVLLTGVIYLAAQTDAFLSMSSTRVKGDVIQLSKNEMLSHLRSILTIILCFAGGILLLKAKTMGWIISYSILLLLMTITSGIFIYNFGILNVTGVFLVIVILMLLMAIFFLTMAKTRLRFKVSNGSYVSVAILLVVLALVYFFLQ